MGSVPKNQLINIGILFVFLLFIFAFRYGIEMGTKQKKELGLLQPPKQDPPVISIRHDDGWQTDVFCIIGMDATQLSTQRNVGVADCPHTDIRVFQYLP